MRVPATVRAMLVTLSHDSDISMNFEADVLEPSDAIMLEEEAMRIPPSERTDFVIGEERVQEAIKAKYNVRLLDDFLCRVFNDEYPTLTPH